MSGTPILNKMKQDKWVNKPKGLIDSPSIWTYLSVFNSLYGCSLTPYLRYQFLPVK